MERCTELSGQILRSGYFNPFYRPVQFKGVIDDPSKEEVKSQQHVIPTSPAGII